jgi:hypothetical protein
MQRCSDAGVEIGRDVWRVDKERHRMRATVFEEAVNKSRRRMDAENLLTVGRMFQATGGWKCRDLGTDTHGKTISMGKTGMRLRRLRMTFENADSSDISEMCLRVRDD